MNTNTFTDSTCSDCCGNTEWVSLYYPDERPTRSELAKLGELLSEPFNAFAEPSPGPRPRELRPLIVGRRGFDHTRRRIAPRLDRALAQEPC